MTDTISAKRLIIPVHDNSEFFSDNADYAIIDLDATLIERIKKLAVVVRQMKACKISEFNYTCEFMTTDVDAEPDNGKVALKEFEGRMECNTLNVTDDDFFWSGYYKHTDVRWETDTVRLAVLNEPDVHDERETCVKEEVAA
ncbi:hypothetical protein KI809_02305 [Geobacter pelophilus]|uniref:Uncharacterized protein n=1 Tax=Geoanaerobacter pelophilus TaxID=60036 RepID=A0AAW4KWY9_9BACT|nr:hypothetical protein [Geoanaerobacter pelophilus]MBT0663121.1 hypothetical protein [Geoanaerobacter pelophilus]